MVRSSVEIHALPSEVRKVCLELEKLPQWHSGLINSMEPFKGYSSSLEVGDKLYFRGKYVYAEPTVVANSDEDCRWEANTMGGMLNGSHFWRFEPADLKPGWTRFVHSEDFSGLFAFLMSNWSPGGSWLEGKYEAFDRDLKAKMESTNMR